MPSSPWPVDDEVVGSRRRPHAGTHWGREAEIVCLYADGLLTDDVIEDLATAAERGVTIRIAGASSAIRERIRAAIPTAETYDVLWEWAETPAGRVLMIDRETILVSALTDGGSPEETAIWGSGQRNSLVVVLRAIFAWWLDGSHHYSDD